MGGAFLVDDVLAMNKGWPSLLPHFLTPYLREEEETGVVFLAPSGLRSL